MEFFCNNFLKETRNELLPRMIYANQFINSNNKIKIKLGKI